MEVWAELCSSFRGLQESLGSWPHPSSLCFHPHVASFSPLPVCSLRHNITLDPGFRALRVTRVFSPSEPYACKDTFPAKVTFTGSEVRT